GVVTVLMLFVAVPLLNVGRLTPMGYAYTWLFGYDFLVRGEYTTAMTIAFPPNCMVLAGKPLNMYLVGYSLPAFIYTASRQTVPLHMVLQLIGLFVSILFYGSVFSVLRVFLPHRKALISTAFVCMFGYSYYWIVSVAKHFLLNSGHSTELRKLGQQLAGYGYVSHLFTPLVLIELPALLALSFLCLMLF